MKKTLFILFIQAFSISHGAQAAIVCEGKTHFGSSLKLTLIGGKSAIAEIINPDGSKELEREFEALTTVWDGHMTGLVTAPGLSVKYENHYGCIRNALVTLDVRGGDAGFIDSLNIQTCSGGTTPDALCFRGSGVSLTSGKYRSTTQFLGCQTSVQTKNDGRSLDVHILCPGGPWNPKFTCGAANQCKSDPDRSGRSWKVDILTKEKFVLYSEGEPASSKIEFDLEP